MQGVFMRAKYFSISILAAAAFLILGLGAANLEASQYLGEVTWQGSQPGVGNFTMTGGLSRVGGAYYEIQGTGYSVDNSVIFSGGGVLSGNTLKLVVTMMGDDNRASTMRITLDKNSLNGSFVLVDSLSYIPKEWIISQSDPLPPYYPAGNSIASHAVSSLGNLPDTGTLTRTSQPIPLTATVAPLMPLLLE
jgi:hypothetical protein